jgi:hypothetical protein
MILIAATEVAATEHPAMIAVDVRWQTVPAMFGSGPAANELLARWPVSKRVDSSRTDDEDGDVDLAE